MPSTGSAGGAPMHSSATSSMVSQGWSLRGAASGTGTTAINYGLLISQRSFKKGGLDRGPLISGRSIGRSIRASAHRSVRQSIRASVCWSPIRPSVRLSLRPTDRTSVRLSICASVRRSSPTYRVRRTSPACTCGQPVACECASGCAQT